MRSLFRLLRMSEDTIGDCKAGHRVLAGLWEQGARMWHGGSGNVSTGVVQTPLKPGGLEKGVALNGIGRTLPSTRVWAQMTHEGPSTEIHERL